MTAGTLVPHRGRY